MIWVEGTNDRKGQILKKLYGQVLRGRICKMCSRIRKEIVLDGLDRFSWMNDLGGIMEWVSVN